MKLDKFIGMMTGHFDNKEQFDMMQKAGKIYPYAEHINTICNDKIKNIPKDFNGKFVVEESYYETNGKRHASPHIFLIMETDDGIVLSSYEIPAGEDKNTFSYNSMKNVDYAELKKSEKFTPALYHEKSGIWEGGSISQFSPVMTFKLWEKFSDSCLEVSESMEVNGKRTFGYDEGWRGDLKLCKRYSCKCSSWNILVQHNVRKRIYVLSYNEIYQKSNPAAYQHFLNLQCYRNR